MAFIVIFGNLTGADTASWQEVVQYKTIALSARCLYLAGLLLLAAVFTRLAGAVTQYTAHGPVTLYRLAVPCGGI